MPEVADRITIQTKFVDYCVEHDIVDLHCHRYNVSRCPKLRVLLGCDCMQTYDLWKHLRGLVRPFAVNDRLIEQKRFENQKAIERQQNTLALTLE